MSIKKSYVGSINLKKLVHYRGKIKGKSGEVKDCIMIPVEDNALFDSPEYDFLGLNVKIITWDQPDEYDKTGMIVKNHYVKGQKPWSELTEIEKDERKALEPILGNIRSWDTDGARKSSTSYVNSQESDNIKTDAPPF